MGNYFYEIESVLIEHPTIEIICQLGDGKAKVSRDDIAITFCYRSHDVHVNKIVKLSH